MKMTKKQALEIFAFVASRHQDTPDGHAAVKAAFDTLASLQEPTTTTAEGSETITFPAK